MRVDVKPELLRWARERAGREVEDLAGRFPKYREWEDGAAKPTLRQLEGFANAVHAPIGYLFLSAPPEEPLPIPDFRTVGSAPLRRASVDLLDTIYLCQRRQDWYREYALSEGEGPPPFVGSASLADTPELVAARIRDALDFGLDEQSGLRDAEVAFGRFVAAADVLGVLVMVSGVVGNNPRRKLDPAEFRGFALADDLAPLVFVNGADARAARMFTLAHELAHLWLGRSALSDSRPEAPGGRRTETWCNRVAAELLVPLEAVREEHREGEDLGAALSRLARHFKVSKLVVLRRLHDLGALGREAFQAAYREEMNRLLSSPPRSGGDFYPTLKMRVGRRFGHALTVSALEGRTSFSESFRLLGIRKVSTFRQAAASLGAMP